MMVAANDPWQSAAARSWKVIDASTLERDADLEADVVIVGTGAGGGTAAEILADAGLSVILTRRGRFATARDSGCASRKRIPRSTRNPPRARRTTRPSASCRAAA
jgi:choline dehydrogenase-like flavoprotein